MTPIIHTKIAMYPVFLPGTDDLPSGWLNLANVTECLVANDDPMLLEITFIDGELREYHSPHAEAIYEAFKEAYKKYSI